MKIHHLLVFVFLLPCVAVPMQARSASVDVAGIRFTGSTARPAPGHDEVSGAYYISVIAENIGQKDQTLLLGGRIKTDGFQGTVMQSCPLRWDKGNNYFKPALSDLRPLLLKPGERAIIAECSICLEDNITAPVYDAKNYCITYIFSVEDEMKKFYDVWTGEAVLRIPLVHESEKKAAKNAPKPEPDPKVIENTNIPWSEPADDWSKSQAK